MGIDGAKAYEVLDTYGSIVAAGNGPGDEDSGVKAFITVLLVDNNFNLVDAAWDQLDESFEQEAVQDKADHDHLQQEVTVREPGYAYVFVSNEHSTMVDVYFDDLVVTHQLSPIVAGGDYYPFGMTMDGREITQETYRHGYQGQFSEKNLTGGMQEFELRMYDPRIGRWTTTDPYGQYASPYLGMGNIPHIGSDPNGGVCCVTFVQGVGYVADAVVIEASRIGTRSIVSSIASTVLKDGFKIWTSNGLMIQPPVELPPIEISNAMSSEMRQWEGNLAQTTTPNTADLSRGISPPGTLEGLIPVWGSGREAAAAFSSGSYWTGAAYTALAISDVFLVKSIATGLVRGTWKLGSHTWRTTRSWYGKRYELSPGTQVHHWLIHQKTIKKYGLEALANQPWNLKAIPTLGSFSSQTVHAAVHGTSRILHFNAAQRLWYGTPTWFKAGIMSGGGRVPGFID